MVPLSVAQWTPAGMPIQRLISGNSEIESGSEIESATVTQEIAGKLYTTPPAADLINLRHMMSAGIEQSLTEAGLCVCWGVGGMVR